MDRREPVIALAEPPAVGDDWPPESDTEAHS